MVSDDQPARLALDVLAHLAVSEQRLDVFVGDLGEVSRLADAAAYPILALLSLFCLLPFAWLFEGAFDRHTTRYLEALARVTPHLSPPVRAVRFTLAKEVVNRAFANKLVSPWISRYAGEVAEDQFIAMVIDFVTGAFRAPE